MLGETSIERTSMPHLFMSMQVVLNTEFRETSVEAFMGVEAFLLRVSPRHIQVMVDGYIRPVGYHHDQFGQHPDNS